ncbi:MAG: flagellar basal body P-ring formation protein FlgA [Gammaproteobacteria bacterium]|nr:flagellar basal body P-ring formation protein FlgA [Gammaproteobacteria bacterium]
MDRIYLFALMLMPLLAISFSHAKAADDDTPRQDLSLLQNMAEDFAYEQARNLDAERIEVRASPLDRRLKLAQCTDGLETFQPSGSHFPGRGTVGVRCEAPSRWTVYVSVDMEVYTPVVVARDFLRKGQLVSADDLELKSTDIADLSSGYFLDRDQVLGMEVARDVKPGKVLKPSQIRKRKLVHRGDRVSLVVIEGGLQVSSMGEAKGDGAKGDRVLVRNLRSKKEVEGVVEEAGVVRVEL